MFYWDPMYFVFALPALLLAFYAQWRVRSAYNRYLKVPNAGRLTGAQAAERLLQTAGLYVNLEGIQGQLTDHYDPRSKVLRLSQQVAYSPSVAAVGIVAHEVGHAQQDAQAYLPLKLRSGLVPVVNATSWLAPLIFFLGMLLRMPNLAWVGVYLFGGFVLFALITLPVELDASRRALRLLEQSNILVGAAELQGARTVLNAAALTYVAALAQAISTMLYYIFLLGGFRRRR
jgi:hypothetical protein